MEFASWEQSCCTFDERICRGQENGMQLKSLMFYLCKLCTKLVFKVHLQQFVEMINVIINISIFPQSSHATLYVTPLYTTIIECTEVSASFNTVPIEGMEFYADLYQLLKVHADPTNLEKQKNMDPALRQNLSEILIATRPLSFC